jgi:hypothetical protein
MRFPEEGSVTRFLILFDDAKRRLLLLGATRRYLVLSQKVQK